MGSIYSQTYVLTIIYLTTIPRWSFFVDKQHPSILKLDIKFTVMFKSYVECDNGTLLSFVSDLNDVLYSLLCPKFLLKGYWQATYLTVIDIHYFRERDTRRPMLMGSEKVKEHISSNSYSLGRPIIQLF